MNEYYGPFFALTVIGSFLVFIVLMVNTLRGGVRDDWDESEPGPGPGS